MLSTWAAALGPVHSHAGAPPVDDAHLLARHLHQQWPQHPQVRAAALDTLVQATRTAIADGSLQLAQARLHLAQELGLDNQRAQNLTGGPDQEGSIGWLKQAPERRRQQVIAGRQQRLQAIIAQLENDPGIRHEPLRLQHYAAELVPWMLGHPDDPPLHQAMQEILASLHTHPQVAVRSLAVSTSTLASRAAGPQTRRPHQDWVISHLACADAETVCWWTTAVPWPPMAALITP